MTRRLLSLAFPFIEHELNPATSIAVDAEDTAFQMDEDTFRGFYSRTATMLWAYLSRATGDPSAADDLLQETFYRFLKARVSFEKDRKSVV